MEIILNGIITTLMIAIISMSFGILIGTVLAFLRKKEVPILNELAKLYINTFRSLPLVLILLGFYLVLPSLIKPIFSITGDIRFYCAVIAFSLFESAYIAEILRTGFNAIPESQFMACKSVGLTSMQSYKQVILPQALINSLPILVTQFIILLQDTSLVYVIGLTDFFGSMVKTGEMQGNSAYMIGIASVSYLIFFVVLQRIVENLKITNKQKGEIV